MTDELRIMLYPLGYIASTIFMGRFMVQWFQSEINQRSVVPKLFWQLSLIANILLMIHSFLQVQYTICVVQACNTVISWRNLNLMKKPEKQVTFRTVVILLIASILLSALGFILQGIFIIGKIEWMRAPLTGWNDTSNHIPLIWHLFGTIGIFLFSARFWIQWWNAEKQKTSSLGPAFWWLSLFGAVLSVSYFAKMGDIVNVIGPGLGTIPYLRNLMLIRKERLKQRQEINDAT